MCKQLSGYRTLDGLSIFLLVCLVVILETGCVKTAKPINQKNQLFRELVVWRKPGTDVQFEQWLETVRLQGDVVVKYDCKECDNSLMLLTGRGIEILIQGPPASGGRQPYVKQGVVGQDGDIFMSFNYPIVLDTISVTASNNPSPGNVNYSQSKKVKVAVFDTGIEPDEFDGYMFKSTVPACLPDAFIGWNFADGNNSTNDNHTGKHGTTVARLISEQVAKYANNPVEILPVKTHASDGTSDLYHVLCGFAYAAERKVDIINASFGFYAADLTPVDPFPSTDPKLVLFKEYIKYYLTNKKILLVAAAGNKNDDLEHEAFDIYGLPYPADLRDLEKVSFYPASFARDPELPNVIAVTTVDTARPTKFCYQNYSNKVVDIGVQADVVLPEDHFVFHNPRRNLFDHTVEGSSFATPIFTGKLCALYSYYAGDFSKTAIIAKLRENGFIQQFPRLEPKINGGQIIQR